MPNVDVDGASVAYQVEGRGPALVLVSGTGGNLESNWAHLMPALSARYTVVRVDYAGSSGDTRDDVAELTIDRLAGQVAAAINATGIDRFHLVGYSLGSSIALQTAIIFADRVRSLTLLAGFASGRDTRFALQSALWRDLIGHDPRQFARLIILTGLSPQALSSFQESDVKLWIDAICSNNDWEGISRQIVLDATLDVSALLPRLSVPTLSIGCEHDHMVPPQHARQLASAIPGARYRELPCGHLAPFEQPDAFLELLNDFTSDH